MIYTASGTVLRYKVNSCAGRWRAPFLYLILGFCLRQTNTSKGLAAAMQIVRDSWCTSLLSFLGFDEQSGVNTTNSITNLP